MKSDNTDLKALAICNVGFEEETIQEIREILSDKDNKVEFKIKEGMILFGIKSYEDLARITFESQTLIKTFLLVAENNSQEILAEAVAAEKYRLFLEKPIKIFYKDILTKSELIESQKKHEEDEKPNEEHKQKIISFAGKLTKQVKDNLGFDIKVSMNDFKTGIYLIAHSNDVFLCIDFSGKELSKRDYRIFCHKNALNATIASSLIYFSDACRFLKKSARKNPIVILDPFCGSGTIPIEMGIKFNRISPQRFEEDKLAYKNFGITVKEVDDDIIENETVRIMGYDNMLPNVKASQKNAKIANLNKIVEFSKVGTDWLDIKFSEKEVDMIVTDPPVISKASDEKEILKSYKELFYQAEFILKKEGTITIICQNDRVKGFADKFTLIKEKEIFQGKQKMIVMQFKRKEK